MLIFRIFDFVYYAFWLFIQSLFVLGPSWRPRNLLSLYFLALSIRCYILSRFVLLFCVLSQCVVLQCYFIFSAGFSCITYCRIAGVLCMLRILLSCLHLSYFTFCRCASYPYLFFPTFCHTSGVLCTLFCISRDKNRSRLPLSASSTASCTVISVGTNVTWSIEPVLDIPSSSMVTAQGDQKI